jgi:hypothetical protein
MRSACVSTSSSHLQSALTAAVGVALLASMSATAWAQAPAPPAEAASVQPQAAVSQPAANILNAAPGAYDFAPGVLTTIAPDVDREDAIAVHDIVELRANPQLAWTPSSTTKSRTLYEMANDAVFVNDVWCLEFTFKPMRMIAVDVPLPNGRLQRKLIWYMVYRVRNTGAGITGQVQPDGTYLTADKPTDAVRFLPELTLVSHDRSAGERVRKAYLDRIVPSALPAIKQRELPEGELLHSAELPERELPVEAGRAQRGVWGVAMWEDVDPRIDFFSIDVRGLSNAYQWTDPEGAYKQGDPLGRGRRFTWKTLQLNFWRPGDELDQNEREIRFGPAPERSFLYDVPEGVAYRWLYR